jgi:hypothetical protein
VRRGKIKMHAVTLDPTLGELGSDVAEPVRGDRGAAIGIDQARSLTGITQRIVEQIKGRHWPTTTEEEIPHLRPGPLVEQRPLRSTAPQRNDRAKRLSSFFVEWHDPLLQRLACRDAEPRTAPDRKPDSSGRGPRPIATSSAILRRSPSPAC